jgi:methionyl-tRNA formyltransferase
MEDKPFRTIALLGREPGLLVLRGALLGNRLIDLVAVYTHGSLPKAEGAGPRPELGRYIRECETAKVPLYILNLPDARQLDSHLPPGPFDLLVVLSWRCVLSKSILDLPKSGSINVHRGALPRYRGARPVQQAIEAGDSSVYITAHRMTEMVDAGPTIATVKMDIRPLSTNVSAEDYAERVKIALYPLYAPLVRLSIASLTASCELG